MKSVASTTLSLHGVGHSATPRGVACRKCHLFPSCGGPADDLFQLIGCVSNCDRCIERGCDYTCPNNQELYLRRRADVDGLEDFSIPTTLSPDSTGLPQYLPLIYHGYSRAIPLNCDFVALPLFRVLRHLDRKTYGCRFRSPQELRQFFKLKPGAKIILVGVAVDRQLEWFWNKHRLCSVPDLLSPLGCIGVTAPNFSFFSDAPRYHILYNRKRILLSMERLSAAGVAVMPHLNALTDPDWAFWLEFLEDHEEINIVAKEFQTGNRRRAPGDWSLGKLIELQQRLGRPLHPLLVGGGRYFQEAKANFATFSIIDSQPFLQTMSRKRLSETGGRWEFVDNPLPRGTQVDALFENNVLNYPEKLNQPRGCAEQMAVEDTATRTFDFFSSMPNLISQPVAPGVC